MPLVRLCFVLLMAVARLEADQLFVTPEGGKYLDEIRGALGENCSLLDVPKEAGYAQKYFFRGAVVATKPPRDLKAKWNSKEGSAWLRVRAFPDEAGRRPADVELPEVWFSVVQEMDSFLDLRMYCSNRDKLYATRIGSSKYNSLLMQAIDFGGTLGLLAPSGEAEKEGLREGVYVKRLRSWKRYQFDPTDSGPKPETMNLVQEFYEDHRGKGHSQMWLALNAPRGPSYDTDAYEWIVSIARNRRYQLYEPGLERAMFSLLGARLKFARVDAVDNYSKFVKAHGYGARDAIAEYIDPQKVDTMRRLKEDQMALQGYPVSGSELIDIGLDLAAAYPEVLVDLMNEEKAKARLANCTFVPGYKVGSLREGFPRLLTLDRENGFYPEAPTVRQDRLLWIISNPPSQQEGEPLPLKQKALSLLATLVRGEFGDLDERYQAAAELTRYESILDLTNFMHGMIRASVEDKGGKGDGETIEERISRSYVVWRSVLGVLQGAQWPGRSEAYVKEICGALESAITGHADACWRGQEDGDEKVVERAQKELDHCLRMFLGVKEIPNVNAAAKGMIDEVKRWEELYGVKGANRSFSEWEIIMHQRYLEVTK